MIPSGQVVVKEEMYFTSEADAPTEGASYLNVVVTSVWGSGEEV